ncbi:MAG: PTS sugar transporter subunit IIA [Candidatus Auribacterota bacterium]|nr:PTS sugar transporter subunit IIA [Candidatus Auribacterota bacterium]
MQKLTEFISSKGVIKLKGSNSESAIRELAGTFDGLNKDVIVERTLRREAMVSTAIVPEIAFPHARLETQKRLTIAVGRSEKGVDFNSFDGGPVKLVFLMVWQPSTPGLFTQLFSSLIKSLRKHGFREKLLSAKTESIMLNLLSSIKVKVVEDANYDVVCAASVLRKLQEKERKRMRLKKKSPKLEKEISTLQSYMNSDYLSRFNRLMGRYGTAIVDVEDGVCQGCFMTLSTSLQNQIKYENHVYVCENCSRFIALKDKG